MWCKNLELISLLLVIVRRGKKGWEGTWQQPVTTNRLSAGISTILYESEKWVSVAQLHLTLWDPMDRSQQGSSVHEFSRQKYWSG